MCASDQEKKYIYTNIISKKEKKTLTIKLCPHLLLVIQATAFCDASAHDDMAPTQHNLLCLGQSVKDVVFGHTDLRLMCV